MPPDLKEIVVDLARHDPETTYIWKYEAEDGVGKDVDNLVKSSWTPQYELLSRPLSTYFFRERQDLGIRKPRGNGERSGGGLHRDPVGRRGTLRRPNTVVLNDGLPRRCHLCGKVATSTERGPGEGRPESFA